MKKRKRQKLASNSKRGVVRIPARVLSDSEFSKLIDRIKSGKVRPVDKDDLHSRATKIKTTRSFGMAHRMCTIEEKMRRLDDCIPTYIVDVQNEECKVIYLSGEQRLRIRELKASIQRPVKPVKPIKTKPDDKKATGGNK